jgi:hypothetical protein
VGQRADAEPAPLLPGRNQRRQHPDRRRWLHRSRNHHLHRNTQRRTTSTPTTATATATSATTATATSATTTASSASDALSCPESPRAASRGCEAQDPGGPLLGRQGSTRSCAPLTAWPRGEPVTAARHDQAPELPGEAGGRSALNDEANARKGGTPAPAGVPLLLRRLPPSR